MEGLMSWPLIFSPRACNTLAAHNLCCLCCKLRSLRFL